MKFTQLLLIVFLSICMLACANNKATNLTKIADCTDNERVIQSFSFGNHGENQGVEVIDLFYGIPNCPANYNSGSNQYNGKPLQATNITGPMRRADKLHVKWRIKNTGQEFEINLDLRNKLPNDMTNHEVHFTISGAQLYVYLITPERRPPDLPPNGPRETQYLKTLTIYPD